MKILLTGASGLLGQAIVQAAPGFAKKHSLSLEFIGIDIREPAANTPNLEFHHGSYTDQALLEQLIPQCDAVVHTAALHGGCLKTHTPTEFIAENVGGLCTLLETCIKHQLRRVVFSSTMEILVGRDWYASGMQRLDEASPPRCDSIYSQSKLQGEHLGAYCARKFDIEFFALRYMNIEPPGYHPLQLLGRGNSASDVALANLHAVIAPPIEFEVLLVAPETPLTNQDIVRAQSDPQAVLEGYWPGATAILEQNGLKIGPLFFANPININKTKRILKWQPTTTFETWLISQGWKRPN
jgi:UDP-glucose 4-epimerase